MKSLLRSAVIPIVMLVMMRGCHRPEEKFVNDEQLILSISRHETMNRQMLQRLEKYGVHDNSGVNLNVFFDSNDSSKMHSLSMDLPENGYHMNTLHSSSKDKGRWVLGGSSPTVNMDVERLNDWSRSLCERSFGFDYAFQGWNPVTE